MSSLPSLSLGSRFWVKNCSDISTDLGTLPLSHQHPVPACWAGIFWGTGSLRQQIPFGNEFLQNSCLERRSCCILWVKKERKEAAKYLQSFCDFPIVSEGRLQGQPSSKSFWVVGLNFSLSQKQTNTTRKTRLAHVFGDCDLVLSVNLLVLFTLGGCDWMPPGKCCRWFHTVMRILSL